MDEKTIQLTKAEENQRARQLAYESYDDFRMNFLLRSASKDGKNFNSFEDLIAYRKTKLKEKKSKSRVLPRGKVLDLKGISDIEDPLLTIMQEIDNSIQNFHDGGSYSGEVDEATKKALRGNVLDLISKFRTAQELLEKKGARILRAEDFKTIIRNLYQLMGKDLNSFTPHSIKHFFGQLGKAYGFFTEQALQEVIGSEAGKAFITDKLNLAQKIAEVAQGLPSAPNTTIRGEVQGRIENRKGEISQTIGAGFALGDIKAVGENLQILFNMSVKRYNIKTEHAGAVTISTLGTIFGKLVSPVEKSKQMWFYRAASLNADHAKEVALYLIAKNLEQIYFSKDKDETNVIIINYKMMNMLDFMLASTTSASVKTESDVSGSRYLVMRPKRKWTDFFGGQIFDYFQPKMAGAKIQVTTTISNWQDLVKNRL